MNCYPASREYMPQRAQRSQSKRPALALCDLCGKSKHVRVESKSRLCFFERQLQPAQRDRIAIAQRLFGHLLAINKGAIGRTKVGKPEAPRAVAQLGMVTRDTCIIQDDIVVQAASNRQLRAF